MMFPMSKAKTKIRNDLFPILDDEYEDYLDDASTCHSPPPQSHQKSQPPPLPPKKRSDPNTSLIATPTQKLSTSATLPNVSSHQQLFSPESLAPSDGGGSERLIPILRESDGTVVVPKKQSTAPPFSEGSDDQTTTSTESTRYSSLPNSSTPRVF